ncbi:thioredoxin family protein [Dethiosulfovibrio salsuginis]|uniref:Thioredoxin n=1 Tax=Dethiosulfovibrio salsuginis TaxID=561720 RepID=A0A1X7J0H1_9BACT|nr:thioredoxin family protein [Dethiosulfovibrio salsuginis]SMG20961.1 thioredoxin 1 [Dethiosulfovibrio salsuginis]
MIELDKDTFDAEVKESDIPVLVDFWGPKCTHCLALMPGVEELAKEYDGKVKFCKVNIQGNRRVAISLKVMGLPAFLFWKGGEEQARISGDSVTIDQIRQELDKLL